MNSSSGHRYHTTILWLRELKKGGGNYLPYDLHLRRAEVRELVGMWSEALGTYRDLAGITEGASLTVLAAAQLVNIGRVLYKMGDHAEAEENLLKADAIFQQLGDLKQQADVCNLLGNIRLNQTRYQEARMLFERRLELNTKSNDASGLCATYGNLGNLEYVRGDLALAEEWYRRQDENARKEDRKDFQAIAMGAMGCIYAQRGEYDKAIKSFSKFLDLSTAIGDTGKIRVAYGNIGNYYVQFENYPLARDNYRRQLILAKRMGEKKGTCLALGNLGKVSYHLGEYENALREIQEAIIIGEKLGLKYFLPEQYLLLAEIQMALNNLSEAERAAARSHQLAEENGDADDEKSAKELQERISKTKAVVR
ncbi:tetratricopeptide repeat protein [candidate division TA06 bacterium]|nr:tetratricopeptide repeat protein [candidate division TA06 bacterium]